MPCGTLTEGSLSFQTDICTVARSTECTSNPFDLTIERSVDFRKTTGECIPNYHARRKRGELLPHTNFSQFEVKGDSWGSIDYTYKADNCRSYNTSHFGHREDRNYEWVPSEAHLRTYAPEFSYEIQKAAAAISSSGHDTLTFLAELAKTKRMVKNLLTSIVTGKFDFSIASVPGKWLELRYGWRTLLFDIEDLHSALVEFDTMRTRYSQRSGSNLRSSHEEAPWTIWDNGGAREEAWYEDTVNISVRGSVTADVTPPRFSLNPVITGWELVPLSFVLDWVINVGMWLESLSFLAMSSKHVASGGYKIELIRQFYTKVNVYNDAASPYSYGSYYSTSRCVATLTERFPSSVSLIPQSQLRLNEFKVLDLCALILQRIH